MSDTDKSSEDSSRSPFIVLSSLFFLNVIFLTVIVLLSIQMVNEVRVMISDLRSIDTIEKIEDTASVTQLVSEIIEEGDFNKINQYNREVNDLNVLIENLETITTDSKLKDLSQDWRKVNDQLVEIELSALQAAQNGNLEEADSILGGVEYDHLIDKYDDILVRSILIANQRYEDSQDSIRNSTYLIVSAAAAILISLIFAWILTFRSVGRFISDRRRMVSKLKLISEKDSLTGLYNRLGFINVAEKVWKEAIKSDQKLSIMFIDLDGLKTINDRFGHKTGDEALISTAALLKKTFRDSDIIGRIGGDEFVVVAKRSSASDYELFQDRLEKNKESYNLESHGKCPYKLSMSLGILVCNPNEMSLDKALAEADELMYRQKRSRVDSRNSDDNES